MATYTTKFKPGDMVMVADRFGGGRFAGVVESVGIFIDSCSYWVKSDYGVVSAYREDELIADLAPAQKLANGDKVSVKFNGQVVHDSGFGWVVVEYGPSGRSFTVPRDVVTPST